MDVKQAVATAKMQFFQAFENEAVNDVALEEVRHDADAHEWQITLSYIRTTSVAAKPEGSGLLLSDFLRRSPDRIYKQVFFSDGTTPGGASARIQNYTR